MRWQQRGLFVLGGVMVGVVAVVFASLANYAQQRFELLLDHGRFLPLLVTPLGFALCVYAANRWFRGSQGSGIPQVIVAHRLTDVAARRRLVSVPLALGKIALTSVGLLCGASTGREGPTVQVGAALMLAMGRLSPRKQPGLIVAGAAAGVAAAFNTPIAGIIFAIEELARTFERRTSGLVVATVVAAGSVSLVLVGNYTYFGTTADTLHGAAAWGAIPLCGIGGGLLGALFSKLLVAVATGTRGLAAHARRTPVLFAAAAGFVVAITGLVSGESTYGTGYSQVSGALGAAAPLPLLFMPLKFIATLCSSMTGIPGGIFSPSLAIGAGLGAEVARLFSGVDVGAVILLGMVGYLTGVVQAPITAFVIVTELTNNRQMLMPLMVTALLAYGTSRVVSPDGVYHALARHLMTGLSPAKTLQASPAEPSARPAVVS